MQTIFPYFISALLSVISGTLLYYLQKANKRADEEKKKRLEAEEKRIADEEKWKETVTQALIQLLRIQLCEYHEKYVKEKSIPTYAYDNWCRMYLQYKSLGGNGMVTHMNEEIESLNMQNK